jgi:protein-disulfide isomerase
MKIAARAFLVLASLLVFGMPANAARDWTRTVTATKDGGYLVGNPAAPHKLIEYYSLTCPHCQHFTVEGLPALRSQYIAPGKLSLELRNFILNGPDLAASILLRCGTPATAVRLYDEVFAHQQDLFGRISALSADAEARISAAPEQQRPAVFAKEAGLIDWFAARGIPAPKGTACLSDPTGLKALIAMREAAVTRYNVAGTPGFVVDGTLVDGADWASLKSVLDKNVH